ncbi:anti-sigma factor [Amycolatopsis sp. Hca4]|uniref:anti-sigma factor domain-containing protein n=1 Tax=Amycolatopsis sp. Hca4 TaxID=2742131 RepID=UPI0015903C14|nr:anti-sigma factor [Amycolatopsis sp. Hca4]QKV73898.1 anti-sigma factor [Amycolatopsis sp. Hca4]
MAGLGRETKTEATLPPVGEAVWARIAAETGHATNPGGGGGRLLPLERPGGGRASAGWLSRGVRYTIIAAAAAAVGVVGTLAAVDTGAGDTRVVAETELIRQAAAPADAAGKVQVVVTGDGALRLKVQLTGMPAPAGLYEIWLYDGSRTMIPLGVTTGGDADVAVPPNVALRSFPVVDISAQQLGQQAHGVSMLQGNLGT